MELHVGVIGDFNENNPTHLQTNDALLHAASGLGAQLQYRWLPTDEDHEYEQFHALWCSPGSPYKSIDGALEAIRYARENGTPLIGTCGGFQHMVLEYARNVIGLADATHAEYDPYGSQLIVRPLSCSLKGKTMKVRLEPNSKAFLAYRTPEFDEQYYCDFGLNPEYRSTLELAGLAITGFDEDGEARIVEIASHPFYVGTLFVPQAQSSPSSPHPLVKAFVQAAAQNK